MSAYTSTLISGHVILTVTVLVATGVETMTTVFYKRHEIYTIAERRYVYAGGGFPFCFGVACWLARLHFYSSHERQGRRDSHGRKVTDHVITDHWAGAWHGTWLQERNQRVIDVVWLFC